MGLKFQREKKPPLILRLAYLLNRFPRLSERRRLGLLLDLEWVANRLVHEASMKALDVGSHPLRKATRSFLESRIPPGASVLDLGCGTGDLLCDLSSMASEVTGIDHSSEAVQHAKKRLEELGRDNVSVEVGDAIGFLRTLDRRFEVIVLSHILEHMDDPERFLRDLTPSAAAIYVEVPDFEGSASNSYREELGRALSYSDLDHVHEFDRREVVELLGAAGLEVCAEDHRLGMLRFWCAVSVR